MYQCYYTDSKGNQCENRQADCWCCELHKKLWQKSNYPAQIKKQRPTIAELKKKVERMRVEARLREMTNKDGQRRAF